MAEVKLLRSMQESLAKRTRALDESGASIDPVSRAQRLGEIAARQQRVLELGSKLAEKIRTGGGAGSAAPSVEPNEGEGESPGGSGGKNGEEP